jgi:hypothetical protein
MPVKANVSSPKIKRQSVHSTYSGRNNTLRSIHSTATKYPAIAYIAYLIVDVFIVYLLSLSFLLNVDYTVAQYVDTVFISLLNVFRIERRTNKLVDSGGNRNSSPLRRSEQRSAEDLMSFSDPRLGNVSIRTEIRLRHPEVAERLGCP